MGAIVLGQHGLLRGQGSEYLHFLTVAIPYLDLGILDNNNNKKKNTHRVESWEG